jgi:hypothetical protein
MESYIVSTGNWKVRIDLDEDDEFSYIEAGTRAIEAVFGMRELNGECEVISLKGEDNREYFKVDEGFDDNPDETPPRPLFSVLTTVCKKSDENNKNRYVLLRTRVLFENASQPINVLLAQKAEEDSPEIIREVLKLEKKIKKNKKKS